MAPPIRSRTYPEALLPNLALIPRRLLAPDRKRESPLWIHRLGTARVCSASDSEQRTDRVSELRPINLAGRAADVSKKGTGRRHPSLRGLTCLLSAWAPACSKSI